MNAEDGSFEKSLQTLEEIVRKLESEKLGLDESLAEYERGIAVLRRCHELLQTAEQKLEIVVRRTSGVELRPAEIGQAIAPAPSPPPNAGDGEAPDRATAPRAKKPKEGTSDRTLWSG